METGQAAEEMRLSFKESPGELPITHLIHASVGIRARGRQREKERVEEGMDDRGKDGRAEGKRRWAFFFYYF